VSCIAVHRESLGNVDRHRLDVTAELQLEQIAVAFGLGQPQRLAFAGDRHKGPVGLAVNHHQVDGVRADIQDGQAQWLDLPGEVAMRRPPRGQGSVGQARQHARMVSRRDPLGRGPVLDDERARFGHR
jgi:hypothetical protein